MNKKTVQLFIDTSKSEKIKVGITIHGKRFDKESDSRVQKAQALLGLINDLLKKHALTIRDVTSISVNSGPGSFTGLRVGVAVANSLGWSLGIPVNGEIRKIALPIYSRDF